MPAAGLHPLAGVAAMLLLCSMVGEGAAQSATVPSLESGVAVATGAAGPIRFDIPRQSLHEALQQYSAATGLSLLYDSNVVAGRISAPLNGSYTAQEALRLLLAGSGMAVRYTSAEAFMLVRETPAGGGDQIAQAAPTPASPKSLIQADADQSRERYFGWMQARMMEALCADPVTAPGSYRLALRFRIDAGNIVRELEIHTSGHPGLSARVRARLTALDLRAAPPPQLLQPVTLLILPTAGAAC
jgi:hypothetical protein